MRRTTRLSRIVTALVTIPVHAAVMKDRCASGPGAGGVGRGVCVASASADAAVARAWARSSGDIRSALMPQ